MSFPFSSISNSRSSSSSSSLVSGVDSSDSAIPVYNSADELYREIRPQWSQIIKNIGMQVDTPKKEAIRGFLAYSNAMSPNMEIVILGAEDLRGDIDLIHNMGTLATDTQVDQQEMSKFIKIAQGIQGKGLKMFVKNHVTRGAIVNDSNWWIFRNDLYMLGAIHAGKEFHVSYVGMGKCDHGIPPKRVLWDAKNNRPRALGRECLMLKSTGYQPVFHKKQLCFMPPEVNNRYTYTQIKKIVESCDLDTITRYLDQAKRFQLTPSPSPSPSPSLSLSQPSSTSPTPSDTTLGPISSPSSDNSARRLDESSSRTVSDDSGYENKGPSTLNEEDD